MARSDMFLEAKGQRTGDIVGESLDGTFRNQIDIDSWSWGMSAPSAVGSGQRTGRVAMRELKLTKRVDKASTALMAVMSKNELLTTAELTVRRTNGNVSTPYLKVKLSQARIIGYAVESAVVGDGSPIVMESVSLSFKSVTVEYTALGPSGGGGTSSFTESTIDD